jgi:hypothetical protein
VGRRRPLWETELCLNFGFGDVPQQTQPGPTYPFDSLLDFTPGFRIANVIEELVTEPSKNKTWSWNDKIPGKVTSEGRGMSMVKGRRWSIWDY